MGDGVPPLIMRVINPSGIERTLLPKPLNKPLMLVVLLQFSLLAILFLFS